MGVAVFRGLKVVWNIIASAMPGASAMGWAIHMVQWQERVTAAV